MARVENLKILKYHTFSRKKYLFLLFAVSVRIFKEEKSIEILKTLGLFENI